MPNITISISDEDVDRIAKRFALKLAEALNEPQTPRPAQPEMLPPQRLFPDDRLQISRSEAARMLGFKNPITVDRLRARGLLHPNLATGRPMYPIKELERFVRECSQPV